MCGRREVRSKKSRDLRERKGEVGSKTLSTDVCVSSEGVRGGVTLNTGDESITLPKTVLMVAGGTVM